MHASGPARSGLVLAIAATLAPSRSTRRRSPTNRLWARRLPVCSHPARGSQVRSPLAEIARRRARGNAARFALVPGLALDGFRSGWLSITIETMRTNVAFPLEHG